MTSKICEMINQVNSLADLKIYNYRSAPVAAVSISTGGGGMSLEQIH